MRRWLKWTRNCVRANSLLRRVFKMTTLPTIFNEVISVMAFLDVAVNRICPPDGSSLPKDKAAQLLRFIATSSFQYTAIRTKSARVPA